MQYSFDLWNQPVPPGLPNETVQEAQAAFPFSQDLAELEASLSMNQQAAAEEAAWRAWDEQARWEETQPALAEAEEAPALAPQPNQEWDDLADTVATYVLAYMQGVKEPLTTDEVKRWQRLADEYHADNRMMAGQIQRLIGEKEELMRRLAGCEIELARYRSLAGNLFLKW